jgi:uncharacterized protein
MEKLHPGAKWLFRVRGYFGIFFFLIFTTIWMAGPIIGLGAIIFGIKAAAWMIGLGVLMFLLLLIFLPEIYARMSYKRWFYEFTPTNLKIEKGIIWKKYSNIPYERVQNVDIHRGILARMLGFSTIMIQTAGSSYSSRGRAGAEGSIPAVLPQKAEEIREFLMKKISKTHGQGM